MKRLIFIRLLLFCVVTYLLGMFLVRLMDIDATQYASISREMLDTGNYLQLYDLGRDYLDKPPMLFWLSSASMYVFGIHDWAYRLPSFLFSLLAIYSTYRLALLFYKTDIALLAALVLASCQAMFLINHDVRTDTMLMGWVAWSIWQLAEWYQYNKWRNLLAAGFAIAGGMMTKGPIALMIPVFAFVPHFILRREWRQFLRWQYLPLVLLIALLLLPMSLGLYQQYDLHPGKTVVGKTINSGLRFFYWTQSFGRITGENTQVENASIFFLLFNMLWSFLPWILFFLAGLAVAIKNIIRGKFYISGKEEAITVSGFLITYLALGSSQVQLPHYIFVAFPFAAIITANFLDTLLFTPKWKSWKKALLAFHAVVFAIFWLALVFLLAIPFDDIPIFLPLLAGCCLVVYILLVVQKNSVFPRVLAVCFFTSIGINVFLNTGFYPALLRYQAGSVAARYINEHHLPKEQVFIYGDLVDARNSLFFYGDYLFKKINHPNELSKGDYVLTSARDYEELVKSKQVTVVYYGKSFPVTRLSFSFLNPKEREELLIPYYIVQIN